MFSGLIEAVGQVAARRTVPEGMRLTVRTPLATELAPGDSVAVNGVCLTVTERRDAEFEADVSPETARITTLGRLAPGADVNLERPLRADARLGGHFVLGHVDGVGELTAVRPEADFSRLTFAFEAGLEPYVVPKGSIAIDGISLTVAGLAGRTLDVQIVPFTREHTNLRRAAVGVAVNLECDIIGKYVVRAVRDRQ